MRQSLLILACCFGMVGCAVTELRNDQDKIRCALLDLYTNQVMDNLVRAVNGLPIVQLDYNNANANVTVKNSANLSDAYATTHSNALTRAAAATLMPMRTATNTFMGGMGAEHTNLVAVSATPLTTSVETYNAYLQFLAIPGSLQVSDTPPPDGAAHICKCFEKRYYWVPAQFKDLFFDLSLVTTVERGRLLVPPPEYFSVVLQKVVGEPQVVEGNLVVTVEVDTEVPNKSGNLEFSGGGWAKVTKHMSTTNKSLELFQTKQIDLTLDPTAAPPGMMTPADFAARLPTSAKLHLPEVQPGAPTTAELLDQISFQPPPAPERKYAVECNLGSLFSCQIMLSP